jgi:hypothetical protein
VESAWNDMLREAIEAESDEFRIVQRWTKARLASELKRTLLASLQCPAALSAEMASKPVETVSLVRDLRLRLGTWTERKVATACKTPVASSSTSLRPTECPHF